MSLGAQLGEGLAALGLVAPPGALALLERYLLLLEKWNHVHNLTAVRELGQMVSLHVLDSLAVLPHLGAARTLLDVGSGAGLPGIPIAILRPDLSVDLLDASHKKAAFLTQARTELDLKNLTVHCHRVETWKPGKQYDVVVSRAFSDLADFVSGAAHLAAAGGKLLAMKGVHPHEEIARLPASHRVSRVVELRVPSLEARRHLVFLEAA